MAKNFKKCKKFKKNSKNILRNKSKDIIILLSFSGENGKLLDFSVKFLDSLKPKQETNSSDFNTFGNVSPWENKIKGVYMVNIFDAANYIVQLYYKTGDKYYCSRTKVEKLLAIANLIAFRNDSKLFDEEILVNRCGVGIPVLATFLYSDIGTGTLETNQHINQDEYSEDEKYPISFKLSSELFSCDKELLFRVFMRFGAYNAWEIGKAFDEFKDMISEPNPDNEEHPIVCFDLANKFLNDDNKYSSFLNNEIVEYVTNYRF